MRFILFKKGDILWWLGLTALWFTARFILALPKIVRNFIMPALSDYCDYVIEGIIVSSLAIIIVGILRNFNEKDKVKEKRIFGIKFVWHKKYVWWWIGMTILWGIGRTLIELYHNISSDIFLNFIRGAFFSGLGFLIAGFWEGNPGFFEGRKSYLDKYLPKSKNKNEKT